MGLTVYKILFTEGVSSYQVTQSPVDWSDTHYHRWVSSMGIGEGVLIDGRIDEPSRVSPPKYSSKITRSDVLQGTKLLLNFCKNDTSYANSPCKNAGLK